VIVFVGGEDEEAECLACGGGGYLPVVCEQCGKELFGSLTGNWAHEEPVHNTHIPRVKRRLP
jgi:hypothetical protein